MLVLNLNLQTLLEAHRIGHIPSLHSIDTILIQWMFAIEPRKCPPVRILPTRSIFVFRPRRMGEGLSIEMKDGVAFTKPDFLVAGNCLEDAPDILAPALGV